MAGCSEGLFANTNKAPLNGSNCPQTQPGSSKIYPGALLLQLSDPFSHSYNRGAEKHCRNQTKRELQRTGPCPIAIRLNPDEPGQQRGAAKQGKRSTETGQHEQDRQRADHGKVRLRDRLFVCVKEKSRYSERDNMLEGDFFWAGPVFKRPAVPWEDGLLPSWPGSGSSPRRLLWPVVG